MHEEDEEEPISKSQRKRESLALRELGERLTQLSDEQLAPLPYPDVLDAIAAIRTINKGNARKRQLQYIGKLLRKIDDLKPAEDLLARYDSASKEHVDQFHQLERWREQLMDGNDGAIDEIAARYPSVDRQQLRQVTRSAINERVKSPDGPTVQFRKLFQFLKSLE